MSSNYPDGVTESMIPGFRPGDEEAERFAEGIDEEELVGRVLDSGFDCEGGVVYEHPDQEGVWVMEHPYDHGVEPWLPEWPRATFTVRGNPHTWLVFESQDDALAYMVVFHDDAMIEAIVQEHLEEGPDYDY